MTDHLDLAESILGSASNDLANVGPSDELALWVAIAQGHALADLALNAGGLAGSDGHQGTPGNHEAAESLTEPQGVAS